METRSKNNVIVVQIKRTRTTAIDLTTFELREEKKYILINQTVTIAIYKLFYILYATIITIIFVKVTRLKMQKKNVPIVFFLYSETRL